MSIEDRRELGEYLRLQLGDIVFALALISRRLTVDRAQFDDSVEETESGRGCRINRNRERHELVKFEFLRAWMVEHLQDMVSMLGANRIAPPEPGRTTSVKDEMEKLASLPDYVFEARHGACSDQMVAMVMEAFWPQAAAFALADGRPGDFQQLPPAVLLAGIKQLVSMTPPDLWPSDILNPDRERTFREMTNPERKSTDDEVFRGDF